MQYQPIQLVLPNSQILKSQKTILPEPHQLPDEARTATVIPGLLGGAITSIGQYCGHGFQVTLDRNYVKVKHKDEIVQQGDMNYINKL